MSTITAFKAGQAGGSDRLTDMLTAPDERVRCLGRAFASRITTDKLPQYMDAVRASRKGGAA